MPKIKKVAVVGADCVACGCCAKVCPWGAIGVHYGIIAKVEENKCVGCGKCTQICPANVVTVVQRKEAKYNEEKALV